MLVLYGVAMSVFTVVPSTLKATFRIPPVSEAVAETVIVPETVEPLDGLVIETVGAVVSFVGGGGVVPLESAPSR